MMHRAEFGVGNKVNYWDGKRFIRAVVTDLNLNPIEKVVEYKLFYREGTDTGKRSRIHVITRPEFIEESQFFKGGKK